jgi:hypothetical protein
VRQTLFALVYVAYKLTRLIDLGLGLGLIDSRSECSSLVTTQCVFSVTSPALAVLLICLGLTVPAVVYPISQARRRRWEVQSFEALGPLWQDLSAAMPGIVLTSVNNAENARTTPTSCSSGGSSRSATASSRFDRTDPAGCRKQRRVRSTRERSEAPQQSRRPS